MRLLLFLPTLALASSIPRLSQDKCWSILDRAGFSMSFPANAAHAAHSLTLEDLRRYFDAQATADNGIPTVNLDLDGNEILFNNALPGQFDERFMTPALRAVDGVLSHMDDRRYDMGNYNSLERVIHALHMQEMWTMIGQHYQDLQKNGPPSKQVCSCVTDVSNNGIKKFLHYLALKIRYTKDMKTAGFKLDRKNPQSYKYDVNDYSSFISKSFGQGEDGYKISFNYDDKSSKIPAQNQGDEGYQISFNYDDKSKSSGTDVPKKTAEQGEEGYAMNFNNEDKKNPKSDQGDEGYGINFSYEDKENSKKETLDQGDEGYGINFSYEDKEKSNKIPKAVDQGDEGYKISFNYDEKSKSTGPEIPKTTDQGDEGYGINFSYEDKKSEEEGYQISFNYEAKENPDELEMNIGTLGRLKDEAAWKVWKSLLLEMDDQAHHEAAVFIYCMLNE